MASAEERLEAISKALAIAREAWDERGEAMFDTGTTYAFDKPVAIRVRKRARRYDLSDEGLAVRHAGKPDGWHSVADRIATAEGFNVNRTGSVFVPAFEASDIATLVLRLADTSRDVALLELDTV